MNKTKTGPRPRLPYLHCVHPVHRGKDGKDIIGPEVARVEGKAAFIRMLHDHYYGNGPGFGDHPRICFHLVGSGNRVLYEAHPIYYRKRDRVVFSVLGDLADAHPENRPPTPAARPDVGQMDGDDDGIRLSPPITIQAREFAEHAHGNQRYGSRPYLVHLEAVARLAEPFGPLAVAAAFLHDVLEDTSVTRDELTREFGAELVGIVDLLTDIPGPNRKARKTATYGRLAAVPAGSPEALALVVKTADRLANLEQSLADGNQRFLAMYQAEQPAFERAVRRPGLADGLWSRLTAAVAAGRDR